MRGGSGRAPRGAAAAGTHRPGRERGPGFETRASGQGPGRLIPDPSVRSALICTDILFKPTATSGPMALRLEQTGKRQLMSQPPGTRPGRHETAKDAANCDTAYFGGIDDINWTWCHLPACGTQRIFGAQEPVSFRRNGASRFSAYLNSDESQQRLLRRSRHPHPDPLPQARGGEGWGGGGPKNRAAEIHRYLGRHMGASRGRTDVSYRTGRSLRCGILLPWRCPWAAGETRCPSIARCSPGCVTASPTARSLAAIHGSAQVVRRCAKSPSVKVVPEFASTRACGMSRVKRPAADVPARTAFSGVDRRSGR